jgi:hypothetical protein
MKSTIFWDITPCSPFKFNRRFGGTNRRIIRARNSREGRAVTCSSATDGQTRGRSFPTSCERATKNVRTWGGLLPQLSARFMEHAHTNCPRRCVMIFAVIARCGCFFELRLSAVFIVMASPWSGVSYHGARCS